MLKVDLVCECDVYAWPLMWCSSQWYEEYIQMTTDTSRSPSGVYNLQSEISLIIYT